MTPLKKLLCDNQQLTGTATASTYAIDVGGRDQHTLYITYSPDTDSTNALTVTIEMSPDGTTWHPYTGTYSGSTGTITPGTPVTLSFDSAGTSDDPQEPYFFNGGAQSIRLKVAETNTPGDFGNVTACVYSNHS